jgi:hypothetical protein
MKDVPRIGRLLDSVGLLLFLGGGALYARSWFGFRDVPDFERPVEGPVLAAVALADGYWRLQKIGVGVIAGWGGRVRAGVVGRAACFVISLSHCRHRPYRLSPPSAEGTRWPPQRSPHPSLLSRTRIAAASEMFSELEEILDGDPEHPGAHGLMGRLHAGVKTATRGEPRE